MTRKVRHGGAIRGKELPEYRIWQNMKRRCGSPTHKHYAFYGGRGIRVCHKWENDFGAFLADVGRRPNPSLTLDRIDNNRGYEPGNIRWATRKQQSRNARMNRLIEFRGKRMPVIAWSEHLGLSEDCLRGRLKRGWSIELALTTPKLARSDCWRFSRRAYRWHGLTIREWSEKLGIASGVLWRRLRQSRWKPGLVFSRPKRTGRKHRAFGSCLTVAQWAKKLGMSAGLIDTRLRRGWSPERALSPTTPEHG